MKIAFSYRPRNPVSFLIRWGTSDSFFDLSAASHVMIIFDNQLVFHSNLERGLHVDWLDRIAASNVIVKSFEPAEALSLEEEEAIYQSVISGYQGRSYDLAGVLYLTWRIFLKKFLKKPIPPINPANTDSQYFCVEAVQALGASFAARLGFEGMTSKDLSMIDPSTLMSLFEENKRLRECQNLSPQ